MISCEGARGRACWGLLSIYLSVGAGEDDGGGGDAGEKEVVFWDIYCVLEQEYSRCFDISLLAVWYMISIFSSRILQVQIPSHSVQAVEY